MADKISVILPVYNAQAFLNDSITSVLSQSWQNWELIIINDGSTDKSQSIIEAFTDPRIIKLIQNNKGVSASRNEGLKKASGDYICFLDADDELSPNSLEARLKVFSTSESIRFVDGQVKVYNSQMKNIIDTWKPSFTGNPFNDLISLNGKSFFGPTWMIKRSSIKEIRLNETMSHAEDLLFYIHIARNGGDYNYCDDVILKYRKGNDSAMKNLKGLEKGYYTLINEISKLKEIEESQISLIRKKVKDMMMKAYLKDLKIFSAISLFTRK